MPSQSCFNQCKAGAPQHPLCLELGPCLSCPPVRDLWDKAAGDEAGEGQGHPFVQIGKTAAFSSRALFQRVGAGGVLTRPPEPSSPKCWTYELTWRRKQNIEVNPPGPKRVQNHKPNFKSP